MIWAISLLAWPWPLTDPLRRVAVHHQRPSSRPVLRRTWWSGGRAENRDET